MKIGILLLITHDVVEKLVGMGLLTAEGDFTSPDLEKDLQLISVITDCIQARGIDVDDKVEKIIKALPLIVTLIK